MINIKCIQCIYIQNHDMPKQIFAKTLTRVYEKVMWIKFQYLSLINVLVQIMRYFCLLYSVVYPIYTI